jgi:hypothetical protein
MNGEWPRRSKVALVALVVFLATLALGALWNATCFLPHCDNLHTAPAVIEKPTDFVGGQLQCAKSVAMQPCADSKKTECDQDCFNKMFGSVLNDPPQPVHELSALAAKYMLCPSLPVCSFHLIRNGDVVYSRLTQAGTMHGKGYKPYQKQAAELYKRTCEASSNSSVQHIKDGSLMAAFLGGDFASGEDFDYGQDSHFRGSITKSEACTCFYYGTPTVCPINATNRLVWEYGHNFWMPTSSYRNIGGWNVRYKCTGTDRYTGWYGFNWGKYASWSKNARKGVMQWDTNSDGCITIAEVLQRIKSLVSAEWLRNADPCLLVNGIQHIDAQYHYLTELPSFFSDSERKKLSMQQVILRNTTLCRQLLHSASSENWISAAHRL